MAEYDKAIALAKRLIEKKGRLMSFQRVSTDAPDPDTPWEVDVIATPKHSARAVVFPVEQKYVDGTTIRQTDQQMLVAAASLPEELTLSFRIQDGGLTYEVVKIEELKPGEQRILYTVFVR